MFGRMVYPSKDVQLFSLHCRIEPPFDLYYSIVHIRFICEFIFVTVIQALFRISFYLFMYALVVFFCCRVCLILSFFFLSFLPLFHCSVLCTSIVRVYFNVHLNIAILYLVAKEIVKWIVFLFKKFFFFFLRTVVVYVILNIF